MSKDEKKASVSELLTFFKEVIDTGIDSGADADLTPIELIYIAVDTTYRKAVVDHILSQVRPGQEVAAGMGSAQGEAFEPPSAQILPFKPVTPTGRETT